MRGPAARGAPGVTATLLRRANTTVPAALSSAPHLRLRLTPARSHAPRRR
jgi:hypothetical protein